MSSITVEGIEVEVTDVTDVSFSGSMILPSSKLGVDGRRVDDNIETGQVVEDVDVEDDEGAGEEDEGCQAAAEEEQCLHRKNGTQKKKKRRKTLIVDHVAQFIVIIIF